MRNDQRKAVDKGEDVRRVVEKAALGQDQAGEDAKQPNQHEQFQALHEFSRHWYRSCGADKGAN